MPGRIKIVAIIDDPALAIGVRSELGTTCDLELATSMEVARAHLRGNQDVDMVLITDNASGGTAVARAALLRRVRADIPVVVLARDPEKADLSMALRGRQISEAVKVPWRAGGLVAAAQRVGEVSSLRRELDDARKQMRREIEATRNQMHRRLEAMSAMNELTAAIADAGSYDQLAQTIATGLFRISPKGIGAAMLVVGTRATLHVHCHQPSGREALNATRDRCLEIFRSLTGHSIDEEKLEVSISGDRLGRDSGHDEAGVFTHVAIHHDAKIMGIVVAAANPGLTPAEERRMFSLANRAAETYRRLSTQYDNERRRLSVIAESMVDGLIFMDARSERLLVNPAAAGMLGMAADDVTAATVEETIGLRFRDLVVSRAQAPVECVIEEVVINEHTLRVSVSPVHEGESKLMGVVVVLHDISKAKGLTQSKNDFVARVSHELRTPLTHILGSVSNMLSGLAGPLSEKQRVYLKSVHKSYCQLESLVNNLLDAARSTRDDILGPYTPLSLDEIATNVVARFRDPASEKAIGLHISIPDKRVRMLGDAERLKQVLTHLLSNAIRFTPRGGTIEVEVFGTSVIMDRVGVTVTNSGDPLPKEALERVFGTFEGAESTLTRTGEGAGLGLPIARAIIEAHGGRIWAESLETGTRFVFNLPVAPRTADSDLPDPGAGMVTHTSRQRAPINTSGASVLIVDDDRHSSFMLKGILISAGYDVHVAEDADSALNLARSESPALAVISTSMAEGEGADLIEIFTHDPDIRKIAVLVVSPSKGAREVAMGANADEFLVMPLQQDQFRDTCTRLIQEAGRVDAHRVLVVDDEAMIRMFSRDVLESVGYEVHEAADGVRAVEAAKRFRPDVMVLDISMPELDGFATAERLKADPSTAMIPIIFLSARGETADKVRAFRAGAEDYMVKPFVPEELMARVNKAVERQARELGASPTTQLPGADAIEAEIERRLASHGNDAFCYLDLDNLKAFNDYYGYAKADGVIRQIGDIIRDVIAHEGQAGDFIGHIAGDDFVFITSADRVTKVCNTICNTFDRLIPLYYNKADRERGFIETVDRYGVMRKFPLMTVSVAAVSLTANPLKNYSDLAAVAAQGKKLAKELHGSSYVLDSKPMLGDLAGTKAPVAAD